MIGHSVHSPPSDSTLIELLHKRAHEQPDLPAYVFLKDGLTVDGTLSYAELDRRARAIAWFLRQRFQTGDRLLLMHPPGLEFVEAFWGCLYAGMVAIPVPPPDAFRVKQSGRRLTAIAQDAQAAGVLTVQETMTLCKESLPDGLLGKPDSWILSDTLGCEGEESWTGPPTRADDLAYLQYTSGSTSSPKGAMVSHGNLTHHCWCITTAGQYRDDAVTLSWMPHYHDYGLVKGILHPVWIGRPAYLMSAVTFLKRPLRWLQAIQRYRVTHSGGPNFAFRHCVAMTNPKERAALDLSGWHVASCGAEPIVSETMHRFIDAFAPSRFRAEAFYPAYGMAEYTLLITLKPGGERPKDQELDASFLEEGLVRIATTASSGRRTVVSCGRPVGDTTVVIVDPLSHRRCPSDAVGEIWLAGRSVTQGYWNNPKETEQTFHAVIADTQEGPFLRTGDLGFIKDGELYVTGRLKDLIIIRGRNHYPQDIEWTVQQCHPVLRAGSGAAFSVVGAGGEERLIVVQEIERLKDPLDLRELVGQIRQAVAEHHDVLADSILLIKAGTIPKTSSGKIQRQACRQAFHTHELTVVMQDTLTSASSDTAPVTAVTEEFRALPESKRKSFLEAYLEQMMSGLLGCETGRLKGQPLSRLGIDSLKAVELIHHVESAFGITVSLTVFLGDETVADVADLILSRGTSVDDPPSDVSHAIGQDSKLHALSHNQLALWLFHQLEPESAAPNVSVLIGVPSNLDEKVLRAAVEELGHRHPMLRTTYEMGTNEPWQLVHHSLPPGWDITHLSQWAWDRVRQKAMEVAEQPFDLRHGPMWRVHLFRHHEHSFVLLVSHHIAVDGWSMTLLVDELKHIYDAMQSGVMLPAASSSAGYGQFVAWQREALAGARGQELAMYWQEKLAGELPQYDLLYDRPGAPTVLPDYQWQSFAVDPDLRRRLEELGRAQGVTLYVLLLSALEILLFRYTGLEDVVIGSPTFGRTRGQFAGTVGNFVNVVALREQVTGAMTVRTVLDRTRRTVLDALDHQEYPFSLLATQLRNGRDPRRASPVTMLFALQRFHMLHQLDADMMNGQGGRPSPINRTDWDLFVIPQQGGQFALSLEMTESGEGISGCFEYHAGLFTSESIGRMQGHFLQILGEMIEHADRPVSELSLMTDGERERVLNEFNGHPAHQVGGRSIQQRFEDQVRKAPDAIAVMHEGNHATYRELNARANQLAHYLRARGVGPDVVVGLCLERSIDLIVALLAVGKAEGAYLPLDPDYPVKRLELILEDARIRVLLTRTELLTRLPSAHPHTVCLDSECEAIARLSETPPPHIGTDGNLAYVIYTSGSTGQPKGVMIEERSLVNYVEAFSKHIGLCPGDRVLQFASIGFDTAAEEIFPCLAAGGTLILRNSRMLDSMERFLDTCHEWRITVLDLPTALWHELVARMEIDTLTLPPSIRVVIIGGERALPHVLARWFALVPRAVRLVNTYGPTEVTIAATLGDLTPSSAAIGSSQEVSIGRPLAQIQVYVLDSNLRPVPVGVTGELYVGGVGLARGYVKPELTADRFVESPSWIASQPRLYRTGDLARWCVDGTLEYRGRADRQVKIRGYRIELEELESILASHPDILQVAVAVREDLPGDKRLVAFIVPRAGSDLSISRLKLDLKETMPGYMIPSAFVELEALPKTPHGKLDRRALHVALDSRASKLDVTSAYVAPRDATEDMLAHMWGEILHVRDVGVHDNFFELGGNSLLATQLVSRVQSLVKAAVPLRLVFESPTIASLAQLIHQIARDADPLDETPPMARIPRGNPVPLSFAQERMWFLHQLAPDSSAYNIPASVRLHGPLDKAALRCGIAELVHRHESLRTTFGEADGRPVQHIHAVLDPIWTDEDLRGIVRERREEMALQIATTEARRPFDLKHGPLLRILLIQLEDEEHIILLTTHHIISDQWSYGIIARELVENYNAHCDGNIRPARPELEFQYADFVQWQRTWLRGSILDKQLSYWKDRLTDLSTLSLPSDRPRSAAHSFHGDHVSIDLPWALVNKLKQVGVREGATLYMVFLTGFFALLHRLSGQQDLVVGTPIANRNWLPIEGMIGTFVNTLVLRTNVAGDMDCLRLLTKVRQVTLDAYAHQDLPFEKLVEELHPDRSHGGLPLVQVLFNFANTPFARTDFKYLSWSPYEISRGAAQFDLALSIDPMASQKAYLEFNTDLFQRTSIERWLRHYRTLLEAMVEMPTCPVSRLPLLTASERAQVTVEWNATRAVYDTQPFVQLFEEQARRYPLHVAVTCDEEQLTYAELNHRANQLAHYLHGKGVAPEVVVAVQLERSVDLLVSLLGILKAGGAYLPVVPGLPAKRVAVMLETGQAALLVTTNLLNPAIPRHQIPVVLLDQEANAIDAQSTADIPPSAGPCNLAYILFTSGSTGQPKGVEIEHGSLTNFLHSMRKEPGMGADDMMLSVTPLSFDIAGLELYLPLLVGGSIRLANRFQAVDGAWLAKQLDEGYATIVQATPATWRMVVQSGWRGRRDVKVLCGGEALPRDLARQLTDRSNSVWNMYGPTETTIWSTLDRVQPSDDAVSLGRPISNTQVYVLDANREPVPVGVPGELYIGGAGLARGYRGLSQLSTEKFSANPFIPQERVYKTGDLVKWRMDGRLEFVGRMDHQVKLRGFRIELGEIEAVIGTYPTIVQCVAIVREDVPGDIRLVAYVTLNSSGISDVRDLKGFLREQLPDYMIPAAIVTLDAFPLTANGKVNRHALPLPPETPVQTSAELHGPRDRVELQLVAIWEQVLGIAPIGIRDNFFDLGGYSLLALRMFSAIEQIFGKRLPMALLFQAPTIDGLADVLRDEGCSVRWKSLVAIHAQGTRRPFFVVPGVGGNVLVFARLARLLGEDQPFYGLQAQGLDGKAKPYTRVEDMARHYVEEIRSVQPQGPYLLGGTCTGGLVAYEIAQQLTAQGESVRLAIMESWHPSSYHTHWRRPPYVIWPVIFLMKKLTAYIRLMKESPASHWPVFWREKMSTIWGAVYGVHGLELHSDLAHQDQVTYAMFHAAARYDLKPYRGCVLNVIASNRRLADARDDTRVVFSESALGGAQTVYLPAEDSGRLFVVPHVERLARHLQEFWSCDSHPTRSDSVPSRDGQSSRAA